MGSPRGTPFPEGNKAAHGGSRPGAGRKPEWFKNRCKEIIEEVKLLDFLSDVVKGEKKLEPHITAMGDVVHTEPTVETRMKAGDRLKEWGYGKTPLPLRATDEEGEDVGGVILLPVQSSGREGTIIDPKRTRTKRK